MTLKMEDLDHVLKLAHLSITDKEKEQFLPQLQSTLAFMNSLDALELSDIEPSAYANASSHYLREDNIQNQADLFLEENAPKWEDGYFSVPKIGD